MNNVISIGPRLSSSDDWLRQTKAQLLSGRPGDMRHGLTGGMVNAGNQMLGAYLTKQEIDMRGAKKTANQNALAAILKGAQPQTTGHPGLQETTPGGYQGMLDAAKNHMGSDVAQTLLPQLLMDSYKRDNDIHDYEERKRIDRRYAQPKKRETIQGADKHQYFVDDGSRVLPNVKTPDTGPYSGNDMDAQALNLLLKGDPSSQDYASAYHHYSRPKVTTDPKTGQLTTITPDMSAFAPPTFAPPAPPGYGYDRLSGQAPHNATQPHQIALPGATVTQVPGVDPAQVKTQARAAKMAPLLDRAMKLITTGPPPTGSGVGELVDWGASVFGHAPEGAVKIGQLKTIQANLMLSLPRMEGPQSDRDVALYREAAASIGDPAVPNAVKIAALKTIQGINARYVPGGSVGQASGSGSLENSPVGTVIEDHQGQWIMTPNGWQPHTDEAPDVEVRNPMDRLNSRPGF